MNGQFILEGHNPVPCDDLLTWGKWMHTANCTVAYDEPYEGIRVSTVFLGLDHSFGGLGPILFETMVFGGSMDQKMDRYFDWELAEEGHKEILARVIEAGPATQTQEVKPRILRGSEILSKEIRDAAVTYQKVVEVFPDGKSILTCGHMANASQRNPAELGQMRFCSRCTDAKLAKTGDL